jgi:hypothetical protein
MALVALEVFANQMKSHYPVHKDIKNHLWIALGLAVWIFVFLYLSEPFDIHLFTATEKWTLLPLYGVIEGVCYAVPLWYQAHIITNKRQWSTGNEIIFLLMVVLLGTVLNFLFYKNVVVFGEEDIYVFMEYARFVYVPALAIILPFVIICRVVIGKLSQKIQLEDQITIQGKGSYDFIRLNFGELLYVRSADNYVEIHFIENSILQKKLLRGTLSEVQNSFPNLLKTHRSFLINPIHFKQFVTMEKKLSVDLGFESHIPVSRNLQSEVKNKLLLTTNR